MFIVLSLVLVSGGLAQIETNLTCSEVSIPFRSYDLHCGHNYAPTNYNTSKAANFEACADICDRDGWMCQGFVWKEETRTCNCKRNVTAAPYNPDDKYDFAAKLPGTYCNTSTLPFRSYSLHCGYNYVPTNYNTSTQATFLDCANLCDEEGRTCQGFVWKEANQKCNLKRNATRGSPSVDSAYDFAAKLPGTYCNTTTSPFRSYDLHCGYNYAPTNYNTSTKATFRECADACDDEGRQCQGFVWKEESKKCNLKRNATLARPSADVNYDFAAKLPGTYCNTTQSPFRSYQLQCGQNYAPATYNTSIQATFRDCADACDRDGRKCKGFVWKEGTRQCNRKIDTTLAPYVADTKYDFAVKLPGSTCDSAPSPWRNFQLYCGYDYSSNTYDSSTTSTFWACAEACDREAHKCKGFVWKEEAGTCDLKDQVTVQSASQDPDYDFALRLPGTTCASIPGTSWRGYTLQCGHNYVPDTYSTLQRSTFWECADACDADIRGCKAYTWRNDTSTCYLKKDSAPGVAVRDARFDVATKVVGATCDTIERNPWRGYMSQCGRNYRSSTYATVATAAFWGCADVCDRDSRCVAYVWRETGGECYLKDTIIPENSITASELSLAIRIPTGAEAGGCREHDSPWEGFARFCNSDTVAVSLQTAVPASTFAECGKLCNTTGSSPCNGFVFQTVSKRCFLKAIVQPDAVHTAYLNDLAIRLPTECRSLASPWKGYTLQCGHNLASSTYQAVTLGSLQDCIGACDADGDKCRGFVWLQPTSKCFLKDDVGGSIQESTFYDVAIKVSTASSTTSLQTATESCACWVTLMY